MIEQKINTSFFIADLDELSKDEQMLVEKAQNILKTSYSSYLQLLLLLKLLYS